MKSPNRNEILITNEETFLETVEVRQDGDLDVYEVQRTKYAFRLRSHASPWREAQHTFAEIPDYLQHAFFFQTSLDHSMTKRYDHMRCTFKCDARPYIFYHDSIPAIPNWLRYKFRRKKDTVKIHWRHPAWHKLALALGEAKLDLQGSGLRVWEAKEYLPAGETLQLGGTQGDSFLDYQYVLVWRPVTSLSMKATDHLGSSQDVRRSEVDPLTTLEQGVRAENYDHVQRLLLQGVDPTAGDGGYHLTELAVFHSEPHVLCLLLSYGAEMGEFALQYLIRSHALIDSADGGLQGVLARYVAGTRNPLSSAYAIYLALAACRNDSAETSNSVLEQVQAAFHAVTIDLTSQLTLLTQHLQNSASINWRVANTQTLKTLEGELQSVHASDQGLESSAAVTLHTVLNPTNFSASMGQQSINDACPMNIAYQLQDTEFMSTHSVQAYLSDRWIGEEFQKLCCQQKRRRLSTYDHSLLMELLMRGGFMGDFLVPVMAPISHLTFAMTMAPRAFFNSPRGRWAMRLLFEVIYMAAFHYVILASHESESPLVYYLLSAFFMGGLMDSGIEVFARLGSFQRFLASPWNICDLALSSLLMASWVTRVTTHQLENQQSSPGPSGQGQAVQVENTPLAALLVPSSDIIYSVCTILIWLRFWGFVAPIYLPFGPLINIIGQMSVVLFFFIILIIPIPVGTTMGLYSLLRGYNPSASPSPWQVLLQLIQAVMSQYDWTYFSYVDTYPSIYYYATGVLILYTFFVTILIANLLIALVTYKYKPEAVEGLSLLQRAQSIAYYQFQVENQLLSSPFTPIQLLLFYLPYSRRGKSQASSWAVRLWQLPFDGLPLPGDKRRTYTTGAREIPYLIFLLTLYPLLLLIAALAFLMVSPICIVYFAAFGCDRLFAQLLNKPNFHLTLLQRTALFPLLLLSAAVLVWGLLGCGLYLVLGLGVGGIGKVLHCLFWILVGLWSRKGIQVGPDEQSPLTHNTTAKLSPVAQSFHTGTTATSIPVVRRHNGDLFPLEVVRAALVRAGVVNDPSVLAPASVATTTDPVPRYKLESKQSGVENEGVVEGSRASVLEAPGTGSIKAGFHRESSGPKAAPQLAKEADLEVGSRRRRVTEVPAAAELELKEAVKQMQLAQQKVADLYARCAGS